MNEFKKIMDSGLNRMVGVFILVLINLLFNGYNFGNVGEDISNIKSDVEFLRDSQIESIALNIDKQILKIIRDPDDIKKPDFEKAFSDYEKLLSLPGCGPIASRLGPKIARMKKYYETQLLKM